MELKDICVSLDLAKRLKELGVPQQSLYGYWLSNKDKLSRTKWRQWDDEWQAYTVPDDDSGDFSSSVQEEYIAAAYTFNELLEILPNEIQHENQMYYRRIGFNGELIRLTIKYDNGSGEDLNVKSISDSFDAPEQVLAHILIHLIENKLIEI
jgi:hypothetical protein